MNSIRHILLQQSIEFVNVKNLEIVIDQIKQIKNKKNRFSPGTIIMAFMLYSQSSAACNLLRSFFILPHKRYLQHLSSNMDISPENNVNNEHYLYNISSTLTSREKVVILLIYEIDVTAKLDYRAKRVAGYALNSNELVKTILAFMICSAFGNFSEIVKLLPVYNITGEQMVPITYKVIDFIKKCGFELLCIVTDNHRVNRNMFSKLASNSISFPNPSQSDKTIFLSFDTVYIMKNIRNNWLNLKNLDKAFVFPNFYMNEVRISKFNDLRTVYDSEKHLIVKKAYKLNYKSLYPSNLERQKVYLVDNIFHHSTIASMKDFNYSDIAHFLEIIRN